MRRPVLLLAALAACAPAPDAAAPRLRIGAQPRGDAGFAALAAAGVRTVVSVDGLPPDAEAARRHGLRTVHLPLGYDGVPPERALELAKALRELPGPIYLHCHHGRHRAPAAAAVAGVVAGMMTNAEAVDLLRRHGTGEEYAGLWQAALDARPAAPGVLEALRVDFRERAPVPPLAEAMAAMDASLERLREARSVREAVRLRELAAELERTEDAARRPEDYRRRMRAMIEEAAALEAALRHGRTSEADAAVERLAAGCAACHKAYRGRR